MGLLGAWTHEVRSGLWNAQPRLAGQQNLETWRDRWTAREEGFDSIRPVRPQDDRHPCDTLKTHHENNSHPGISPSARHPRPGPSDSTSNSIDRSRWAALLPGSRDHRLDFSAVLACFLLPALLVSERACGLKLAMPALFCRSAAVSCDLVSSRHLSSSIASIPLRRLRHSYPSTTCFASSYAAFSTSSSSSSSSGLATRASRGLAADTTKAVTNASQGLS
jgi:hypothetical protein